MHTRNQSCESSGAQNKRAGPMVSVGQTIISNPSGLAYWEQQEVVSLGLVSVVIVDPMNGRMGTLG